MELTICLALYRHFVKWKKSIMHDPHFNLNCNKNIAVEETKSQDFEIGPGSLSLKSRNRNQKYRNIESYCFFDIR